MSPATAQTQTIAISAMTSIRPLARDDAADEDRELARGDQPDERPGLEERQRADEQIRPLAELARQRP